MNDASGTNIQVGHIVLVPKGTAITYTRGDTRPSPREQIVVVYYLFPEIPGTASVDHISWEVASGKIREAPASSVDILDPRPHRQSFRRYTRGTGPLQGQNTSFVGYEVKCSCGRSSRHNVPLVKAKQYARYHITDVLRGDA